MDNFLGQLLVVSFNFAPKGWALCQGQLLAINQNQALFALLGTTFGGNGTTNFALPDMRGRLALSSGQGNGLANYNLGQRGGEEGHTLLLGEMPQHNHLLNVTTANVDSQNPGPTESFGNTNGPQIYSQQAPNTPMNSGIVGRNGGSQAHENRQPFLALNWIIALQGIFPSQN